MAATSQTTAPLSAETLKGFFTRYMSNPDTVIPDIDNPVQDLLREHFGAEPTTLPSSETKHRIYLDICYVLAVQEFLAEPGRDHVITGIRPPSVPDYSMGEMTFARLMSRPTFAFIPPVFCPPDYGMMSVGYDEEPIPGLRLGLVLVRDDEGPAALWIHPHPHLAKGVIEVMAPTVERCEAIQAQLREASVRLSPFRGQVLKIEQKPWGPQITFMPRARETARDEVILPAGLLDQIERHSLGTVRAAKVLRNTGRHLKRGLLLHGRPGTGKTHTIKYLIGQMPHATIAVMSAGRMQDVAVIREVIDVIVPGVIILDDVDLIAEDRELAGARQQLFQFLDVLDGIAEDEDLLFVMTTNRPNEIEPAIVARPGRVDQAIEVPLPDADSRSRLFDLYCDGIDVSLTEDERDRFIERTEGVTASFIREVLRRASVAALRDGEKARPIPISGARVHTALDELLSPDNPLTPVLLGSVPKHSLPTIAAAAPIAGRGN